MARAAEAATPLSVSLTNVGGGWAGKALELPFQTAAGPVQGQRRTEAGYDWNLSQMMVHLWKR